jgi:glycerol uptake facilitator-like aquaporin
VNHARALLAEGVGTAALVAIVVGSGIMGERLAGGNAAIALLANSLATGFGLFVLIAALAPVSGAHFNPVVSMVEAIDGGLRVRELAPRIAVQCAGALAGTAIAHAMFELALLDPSTRIRTGGAQWFAEAVATAGLVLAIRGSSRHGTLAVAAAVACYIAAAYWFTASTSFANPAVTLGRAWTPTFSGIRPADVVPFVVAQVAGALAGLALARALFGRTGAPARTEEGSPER